jgi:UDP-2,3-diacylglucosamine hydrolase
VEGRICKKGRFGFQWRHVAFLPSKTSAFGLLIRKESTRPEAMSGELDTLGIIAGSQSLPLLFARQARESGVRRLVAVAFENETDPALAALVDEIAWVRVGQLSKMISALTRNGVKQCVMLGQIAPANLFNLRPDLRAMALLLRIKEKNAQSLFGAVAVELSKDGVELIEATPWLRPIMPGLEFRLGAPLSDAQWTDVRFGFHMAKEIARLEIGQLVVVKKGTVLAVEGFEGTDACLARGGELAGESGGATAVKVARLHHDMRFDVPCVGLKTVKICAASRLAVLALEAGTTLVLDQDQLELLCRKHHLSLVTFSASLEKQG